MITIFSKLPLKEGTQQEFTELFKICAANADDYKGVSAHALSFSKEEPNVAFILERYTDEETLVAYFHTEFYENFIKQAGEFLDGDPEMSVTSEAWPQQALDPIAEEDPIRHPFGIKGWTIDRLGRQDGKVFVITGTSSGMGLLASKIMASKGARVIMLNMLEKEGEQAVAAVKQFCNGDADVTNIQMDLGDLDSVRNAAETVKQLTDHIDVLDCNAGVAQIPKQVFTKSGFETHLAVNHLGHFLLCGLLFDTVEKSNGRIVALGSMAYAMNGLTGMNWDDLNAEKEYVPMTVYGASKLAWTLFIFELQRRIERTNKNTQVLLCHPGGALGTGLAKEGVSFYTWWTHKIFAIMAQPMDKGVLSQLMCSTEEDLKSLTLYGPNGPYYMRGPCGTCEIAPHALDEEEAKKMWSASEELTGFAWPKDMQAS